MAAYDICIDRMVLDTIETKIERIERDIDESTMSMDKAINQSQNFLSGNQFEKAKNTTLNCLASSKNTQQNLRAAREYIVTLRNLIDEYAKYCYSGENR